MAKVQGGLGVFEQPFGHHTRVLFLLSPRRIEEGIKKQHEMVERS